MALTRLDSIGALDTIFHRENDGDDEGAWDQILSGSTGSSATGPGDNSSGPYVFSESSGSDDTLPDVSTLTALSTVMASWTGSGRMLLLRACIQGNGTYPNDSASGLQIQGRDSDVDAWSVIDLLEGWAYSNDLTPGDTVIDSLGIAKDIVQAGGWVDFAMAIPDTYTQVRIRNIPSMVGGAFRHDAAIWHIEFRDGGGPQTHAVDAGVARVAFALPQPTVSLRSPQTHAVDAGVARVAFALPQPTVSVARKAVDRIEQAFINTVAPLYDVSMASSLSDPMRCPEAFLHALAYDHHAETYSEGLLGVEYDRKAIRDAREIRSEIGYRRSLDMFVENMEIEYTLSEIFTGTGNTARVTSGEIRVSSLSPLGADETRATKFMNEVFEILFGIRLTLHGGTIILGDEIIFSSHVRAFTAQRLRYDI